VHLYGQPTDMRKSYDGLQALAVMRWAATRSMARCMFSSTAAGIVFHSASLLSNARKFEVRNLL